MSNIGPWQLLIILLIVMMLFGTKRLRGLGSDLGAAIRGVRSSVSSEEEKKDEGDEAAGDATGDDATADTAQLREEDDKPQ